MSDMTDDTDGQVEAGRWGTIPEAALAFKRSTRTIERWCDAGRLKRHPTAQPVLVWIADGQASDTAPDMTDDTIRQIEAAEERALALMERMSDAVGQQTAPVLARLNEALARVETLARENGRQQEQIAALGRVLDVVRQMSDDAEARADQEKERADDLAAQLAAERAARARAEQDRDAERRRTWLDKLLGR